MLKAWTVIEAIRPKTRPTCFLLTIRGRFGRYWMVSKRKLVRVSKIDVVNDLPPTIVVQ